MSSQSLKILINIIHRNPKEKSPTVLWQLFEYYTCYKRNLMPWNLMSIIKRQYMIDNKIPCKDHGIDGISDDFKISLQSKFRNNTSITYTELSTFFTMSKGLLNCDQLFLDILDTSNPCQWIANLPITVTRYNKDHFLIECEQLYENNKQIILNESKEEKVELKLRSYQKEAIKVILNRIFKERETHIEITCAGGKSLIIERCINFLPKITKLNLNILILIPTILLYGKMIEILVDYNPLVFGGKFKNKEETKSNIYICVYNSINKVKDIKFDVIFIDEGHHLETKCDRETYIKTIQNIECKHKVFLTATCKPNTQIDYKYTVSQGIKDGFINDYDIIIPRIKNLIDIRNNDKNNKKLELNYIYKSLVNLIDKRQDIKFILAFCKTINESKTFSKVLNDHNISCCHLDGTFDVSIKTNILDKFEKGIFRVITSVYALSEGIDLPFVDCCLFVSPRSSYINIRQCIGRTLRIMPNKGLSHVILPHYHEEKQLEKFIKNMTKMDERLFENKQLNILSKARIVIENTEINENFTSDDCIEIYYEVYKTIETFSLTTFNKRYHSLKECMIKLGKPPSHHSKNKELAYHGRWCNQLRLQKNRKSHLMTDEKIKLLEQLPGWFWKVQSIEETWNDGYNRLLLWQNVNKVSQIPRTKCNMENRKLKEIKDGKEKEIFKNKIQFEEKTGQWAGAQRVVGCEIGIENNDSDEKIKEKIKLFKEKIKSELRKNKRAILSFEQIKLLMKIPGWYWKEDKWKINYKELEKYIKEYKIENPNKKISMPVTRTPIGKWCGVQRSIIRAMKNGKHYDKCQNLTDIQIKLLEKIEGWYW
jgi:superfamily II DNA or RNA helicase